MAARMDPVGVAHEASRDRWRVWYWDGGAPGLGRRRYGRRFTTEADARVEAARVRAELGVALGAVPHGDVTFGEVVRDWVAHLRKHAKASTVKAYRRDMNCYWLPLLHAHTVDELSIVSFVAAVEAVAEAGLSENTLGGAVRTLNAFLSWAELRDAVGPTAFGTVRQRRAALKQVRTDLRRRKDAIRLEECPDRDDVLRLADELKQRYRGRGRNLVLIMAGTGLRFSEALALRVADVDLDRMALRVDCQLDRLAAWPATTETKGAYPRAREALAWASLRGVLEDAVANADADGWLFPPDVEAFGTRGLWWVNRLTERTREARSAAGWVDNGWNNHWCRHHYATFSLAARPWGHGIDLAVVSRSLGHSRISQTLDTYVQKVGDDAAVMAAAFDAPSPTGEAR
jgi:integrase